MICQPFILLWVVASVMGLENLKVAFKWKYINYKYPSENDRQDAVRSSKFLPENNMPAGLEVYKDRLFITLPRWRRGVHASLAYINLSDPMDSPELRPYPDWESHEQDTDKPGNIICPFRIRADSCGRLWVLDSGIQEFFTDLEVKPKLLIYNLTNDELIRSYIIPNSQLYQNNSFFVNIAVEENNCTDSFAYLADAAHPALVVYDYGRNRSWIVKHHYFHLDPLAGDMNVGGYNFQISDGISGLALSGQDAEGFSSLYFHPTTSFNEFNVSTRVLRNESLATDTTTNFHKFNVLGSRGPKAAQSGAAFFDKKSKVLFYGLINLNAVACWRTTNPNYTMKSQGRVFLSNKTMVFPTDIKVDANDTLWVLSVNLPQFVYSQLHFDEDNFIILKSSVADAIKGTACAPKMVVDPAIWKNLTNIPRSKAVRVRNTLQILSFFFFVILMMR